MLKVGNVVDSDLDQESGMKTGKSPMMSGCSQEAYASQTDTDTQHQQLDANNKYTEWDLQARSPMCRPVPKT